MSNKLRLTFGYEGTSSTRRYTISGIEDSLKSSLKSNIKAVNASLAGGTHGGLSTFFRSDDYDAAEGIGTFKAITAAQLESTETIVIPIVGDDEEEGD